MFRAQIRQMAIVKFSPDRGLALFAPPSSSDGQSSRLMGLLCMVGFFPCPLFTA